MIPDNSVKTLALLIFFGLSFYPFKIIDIKFFFLSSIVFTFSNYGALANRTFTFTHPDVLLMPYNEVFMWGFYCLNANRFINVVQDTSFSKIKILMYAAIFSISFSIIHNELALTLIGSVLLAMALGTFKSKRAYLYVGYFLFMGFVVEFLGLKYHLWYYPHLRYFEFPLWAPLMWANIGLIMSQMSLWIYGTHKS